MKEKKLYIVLYHCGEDEFYYYKTMKELKKDFPDYKTDKFFIGIYKIEKIIFERK